MTPIKHPLCNDVLRRPEGTTEDECGDLHIRREEAAVWSFWKPNEQELAALVNGGSVAMIVCGKTHPPLSILTMTPHEPIPKTVTVDQASALNEAVNKQYRAIVDLAKRMCSTWVKQTAATPERDSLINQFLDVLTLNIGKSEVVRDVPETSNPSEA